MSKFLTTIGKNKILTASPQQPIQIKSIVVGTGTGAATESISTLKNEVWRGNASDPIKQGAKLGFSTLIPLDVGTWSLTEWGWIDATGDLIAYGQLDTPVYKEAGSMSIEPTFYIELSNSTDSNIFVTEYLNFPHNQLTGRSELDAHSIASITGLELELNKPRQYKKITGNYTVSVDDGGVIELDATGGSFIVNLPSAALLKDKKLAFVRTDLTINTVTIKPVTGQKLIGEGRVIDEFPVWSRCNVYFQAADSYWILSRNYNTNVVTAPNDTNHYLVHNGNTVGRVLTNADLVNNLTSGGSDKALTAEQGKLLLDMFANLKTDKGHQKLPNGLIVQWSYLGLPAYDTGGNTSATITFPIAFPNGALHTTTSILAAGKSTNWGDVSSWVESATKTTALVRMASVTLNGLQGTPSAKVFSIGW